LHLSLIALLVNCQHSKLCLIPFSVLITFIELCLFYLCTSAVLHTKVAEKSFGG
jgi:hypothetical protein